MTDPSKYLEQQRAEEIRQEVEMDRSNILGYFAAGLGAIGLGAAIYSTRLAKGGRLVSNLLHFMGSPRGVNVTLDAAANVGNSTAKSNTAGIRSIVDGSFNVKSQAYSLGPIDLIDDLKNSSDIIAAVDGPIADKIRDRTIEYINRRFANLGNNTSYFNHGLQRITVDNVLNDSKAWKNLIGTNQWDALKKARDAGLVSGSNILDRNIYMAPSGVIRDLRARNLFTRVKQGAEGPIREGIFDLFGQSRVISSIVGAPRGIAVLGSTTSWNGPRFYIGGNVYGYSRTSSKEYTEVLLASNRKLRYSGDPLNLVSAARDGNLVDTVEAKTTGIGKWSSAIQIKTGIGREYANRPSVIDRFIINPYKRARSLAKGESVYFKVPYKPASGIGKLGDALVGADIPEAIVRSGTVKVPGGGRAYPASQVTGRKSFIPNRIMALFDLSDDYIVIQKKAYDKLKDISDVKTTITNKDLTVPLPRGGVQAFDSSLDPRLAAQLREVKRDVLTAGGTLSSVQSAMYYDAAASKLFPGISSTRDFLNYTLTRLNSLSSESLLGVGFKPSSNFAVNLMRVAAIPVLYQSTKTAAEYVDYLGESLTGFSIKQGLADLYAGARVLQQEFRSLVGVQQGTKYLEENFPGSINIEGATLARSILAPAAGFSYFLKSGRFGAGTAAAAAIYGLIGGPDPTQTADELRAEYAGETKVPVRKGALWGLGYLPYFGGAPERYDYSWYKKVSTDYEKISLYGSEDNYWKYAANVFGIPFPTPSNLFGLRNLANPYWVDEQNFYSRPYPRTESDLANFPIFGPILGATLGEMLKPTVERQADMPLLKSGIADKGLDPSTARMLGIPAINATAVQLTDPTNMLPMIAKMANIATEPMGVYKFAMEFFGLSLEPNNPSRIAVSSNMTDPGRFLYGSNLGGLFGQTEFLRRFMLGSYSSPYSMNQQVNPLRNNLPNWLPGQYSMFTNDQQYFQDFTVGDAYTKLDDGEARLPGKGYEALNELYSGKPGEYSVVDRFLILADIAPYSQAYREYEKQVMSLNLDPKWQAKVDRAIEYRRKVMGVDDRYPRYTDQLAAMNQETIDSGAYKAVRNLYDTVTQDFLSEIPYFGSKIFPFRSPYDQYRKMYVEGAEFASWNRPYENIIRPAIYDAALEDPATAAMKGGVIGLLAAGPLRWFNPVTALSSQALVFGGAALGAGVSATRIAAGYDQNMIPGFKEQESSAITYMDNLSYVKYRGLEELAKSEGNADLASKYKLLQQSTLVGGNSPIALKSAIPGSAEKKYFEYFATRPNAPQVLEGSPGYFGKAVAKVWTNNYNTQDSADEYVGEYFENKAMPDPTWLGWHPSVSKKAANLKFVDHGLGGVSDDYHRFGFYESQAMELDQRLPDLMQQEIVFTQSPMYYSLRELALENAKKMKKAAQSISSSIYSSPFGSRINVSIFDDNDDTTTAYIRDYLR